MLCLKFRPVLHSDETCPSFQKSCQGESASKQVSSKDNMAPVIYQQADFSSELSSSNWDGLVLSHLHPLTLAAMACFRRQLAEVRAELRLATRTQLTGSQEMEVRISDSSALL